MEIFKHLHSRVDQNTVKADASLSIAMLGFNFLEPHYFSFALPAGAEVTCEAGP